MRLGDLFDLTCVALCRLSPGVRRRCQQWPGLPVPAVLAPRSDRPQQDGLRRPVGPQWSGESRRRPSRRRGHSTPQAPMSITAASCPAVSNAVPLRQCHRGTSGDAVPLCVEGFGPDSADRVDVDVPFEVLHGAAVSPSQVRRVPPRNQLCMPGCGPSVGSTACRAAATARSAANSRGSAIRSTAAASTIEQPVDRPGMRIVGGSAHPWRPRSVSAAAVVQRAQVATGVPSRPPGAYSVALGRRTTSSSPRWKVQLSQPPLPTGSSGRSAHCGN